MKINISYFLDEHGWSICWIYINSELYKMSISHVFGECPIEACLNSLIAIMKGEKKRQFNWYGEPGGEQITIKEIKSEKHLVNFEVNRFSEMYGKEQKEMEKGIDFKIAKTQLMRMFYYEFKKISELLRDKAYAENRKNLFPFRKFREFEDIAIEYIEEK